MTLDHGGEFRALRHRHRDAFDGDVTASLSRHPEVVDTARRGNIVLTYRAEDSAGNVGTASAEARVRALEEQVATERAGAAGAGGVRLVKWAETKGVVTMPIRCADEGRRE